MQKRMHKTTTVNSRWNQQGRWGSKKKEKVQKKRQKGND